MARLILCMLVIGVTSLAVGLVDAFNGYCGDAVPVDQQSSCHFHGGVLPSHWQPLLVLFVLCALLAGVGLGGGTALNWAVALAATLIVAALQWLLFYLSARYWLVEITAAGRNWSGLLALVACLLTLAGPWLVWRAAGLEATRVLPYAMAVLSFSWIVAANFSTWYGATHHF